MAKLAIRNGRVIDPASGLDGIRDVLLEDGRVAAIAAGPDGALNTRGRSSSMLRG